MCFVVEETDTHVKTEFKVAFLIEVLSYGMFVFPLSYLKDCFLNLEIPSYIILVASSFLLQLF